MQSKLRTAIAIDLPLLLVGLFGLLTSVRNCCCPKDPDADSEGDQVRVNADYGPHSKRSLQRLVLGSLKLSFQFVMRLSPLSTTSQGQRQTRRIDAHSLLLNDACFVASIITAMASRTRAMPIIPPTTRGWSPPWSSAPTPVPRLPRYKPRRSAPLSAPPAVVTECTPCALGAHMCARSDQATVALFVIAK